MLDSVLFIVFSVLESTALFYLAFKIFKIDLYPKEMVFAGLIMAFFSYVIRVNNGFAGIDVFTQYLLVFLFLWLLFRIHVFYAAIMTGMSYQLYMLIQSILYLLMSTSGITDFKLHSISIGVYLMQTLSALTAFSIGHYIGRKRKGFDFVPDKPEERIVLGHQEKVLFTLSLPSILIVYLMIYVSENSSQLFILIPLAYAVLLFGYLDFSIKKNRGDEF
ncbi:hypothetical protein H70357_24875 [Paenibacillus sp. FSL H7-0357]|uniref:hypothetical protein n=1 Tax=Paenibacillus sp. FSL H7-0357 TaxID=1536774 RepID=UPI0004F5E0DD|nr:hypothetical protein [Paenibacillus sp. FSL H7-0357]AIQ19581.1 hypothetical protein H70357_24875 [Paenibacillus sp. FSL H7-0357]